MVWYETLAWILLALLLEKLLDYVARPKWLQRKAKRSRTLVVVSRPKAKPKRATIQESCQ